MNFDTYKHHISSNFVPIPKELPEIMSDLTKQILKFQPKNIEEFLANYLESLVSARELFQMAEYTIKNIINYSFDIEDILQSTDLTILQINKVFKIIRDEVSSHLRKFQKAKPINQLNIFRRLISEANVSFENCQIILPLIQKSCKSVGL